MPETDPPHQLEVEHALQPIQDVRLAFPFCPDWFPCMKATGGLWRYDLPENGPHTPLFRSPDA